MTTMYKKAAIALAAGSMAVAAPASATIFEYEMTNGDILTIDTEAKAGTWKGNRIDVQFSGADLANFPGGATPVFSQILSSMTGTWTINGVDYTPTRINGGRYHDWMIKSESSNRINLWSWWGNPVIAGDYVKQIASYRVVEVPAPGMLALFALALAALGVGRRRGRRTALAA
jgi:hypothetical protein